MAQLMENELRALRTHQKLVEAAQRTFRNKMRRINAERQRLVGHENDPEVLVRTGPGPTVEIFHDATEYCRRVNPNAVAAGRYDRLLLFEALNRDLRPCTACAWHLRSRRRRTSGVA
jgi:hypothetical protein